MGGKSSTSTQQITIPPEVLARYNSVNATAERAAAKPFQEYSGDIVAPVNPQQRQGIAGINAAANQAQPTYQQAIAGTQGAYYGAQPYNQVATGYALGAGQNVNASDLNGAAINKYMSPYLSNVVGSEAALLNQNNQQAMAGQLGNAITSGAFGGDRAGIAAANLAQQQQLANANIYSNLLNQGYGQALSTAQQQQGVNLGAEQANRAAYGNAAQLLQGIGQQQFGQGLGAAQQTAALGQGAQEAALQGAQAQVGAGTLEQQTQQAQDTAQYNQFLQQQSYPFQTAQFLANIAEGTGALSGSTTTATQPGGFFSDERLKENIEPIGKTFDGQTIHKYNYKGDPRKQIGLIAQEVERHHPEAVGLAGGYKTVDYDKATSEGGAVGLGHAGEGFAYGGTPMLPGVSSADMSAILQSPQQMYSPYSGAGLYGGKPGGGIYGGSGGHVPSASLPVANLATANMGMPHQKTAFENIKDAADAAKGMQNTWKDAKGAYKNIKDAYNSHKIGQDIKNFHGDGSTAAGAANVVDANTPPEPSLEHSFSDSSAEARGGFVGHYADGGAMPYASSGGDLDIPEVAPQAHSLQTAGSMGGPGQSGLGQIKQVADTANSVKSLFGFADGGLVPSSIDIPEEKPSQQLAVASAPTPQKDQTMQTIMDVAKIAAMFAARGGAVHREGHAYGGMPGANPALEGINHPSMAVTPSTGGAKGMMHQPMHPALAHALENMRHADGGRIHKAFAGSVDGLDPQDFSSSSNASGSFDTPEPSWWEKNVTGVPEQRSGFGQLIDKMNQQSADQVALENERKVREERRNALARQTGFFSPGTPEELAIKRQKLDEANANLNDLQKPGALQRIQQQSADRVPPLVPQQPTGLSPQPAAPAAAANKPASRVAPAAPAESPAAPLTADAGLAAAKPSYEPPTNAVPEAAGISPPSTQSLLDKALANPRDQGLAATKSAELTKPVAPETEQEHKQNLLAKALGLFKTNGEYDSGKVIPFLTGLAAMGTAPTRSLGVALSTGVGAGAQSYMNTKEQLANLAQTQAQTGNIKASTNLTYATTLQELTAGKPPGTVVIEDPEGQFVTQDGKHYSILPAAATFKKTNQPDLRSVKYDYLGPSGMDAAKSAVREYDFTTDPLMKNTSTKIYNETMADADQARSELTKNRLWLQSVASLEPGSLTEPGALNGFLSGIVAKTNAVLGKLDPSLVIDPKGLTDQQIAQKLSTNSAALTEAGLGQRSVAALQTLSKATANPEMTRNAALTLIADQIAESERRIDQANYLNEYEQEAKRNSSYEGTGAGHFLANRAIRAFGADRPASSYESDRGAILELARDKPKQLAQMYEIMRSGSPEDKEYLRQKLEIKYGKNFARYITGE